jgi:hypothetical protein
MSVRIEPELAKQIQMVDWSEVILQICGKKKWRMSTLARHLNASSPGLGKIARYEVQEPRIGLAIKLLDMYAEVVEGKQ